MLLPWRKVNFECILFPTWQAGVLLSRRHQRRLIPLGRTPVHSSPNVAASVTALLNHSVSFCFFSSEDCPLELDRPYLPEICDPIETPARRDNRRRNNCGRASSLSDTEIYCGRQYPVLTMSCFSGYPVKESVCECTIWGCAKSFQLRVLRFL